MLLSLLPKSSTPNDELLEFPAAVEVSIAELAKVCSDLGGNSPTEPCPPEGLLVCMIDAVDFACVLGSRGLGNKPRLGLELVVLEAFGGGARVCGRFEASAW